MYQNSQTKNKKNTIQSDSSSLSKSAYSNASSVNISETYALEAKNISFSYKYNNDNNTDQNKEGKAVQILENINLLIKKGEKVLLTGASGSGKTTLLHILGKILEPSNTSMISKNKIISTVSGAENREETISAGEVIHFGKCSFIFQANYLLSNCTAIENVALGLIVQGMSWEEAVKEAESLLHEVDMIHRANALPAQLSGGEKQRIAVARALATKPDIILCDEPTGNLDDVRTNIVFRLLSELSAKYNSAILVVSHESNIPMKFDTHYHLYKGHLSSVENS